jgi:transcriptional repressor NrdR
VSGSHTLRIQRVAAPHPGPLPALLERVADLPTRGERKARAMRCPYCNGENTQVKDSRPTEESSAIRRRRACEDCGGRFTTFERVQLREIVVVKRSGRREPFDRAKLLHSVEVALRKRPIEGEQIERVVSGLVRRLESMGEQDVPSSVIGELAMEALKGLDAVAYVRFASVYRHFGQAADFQEVLAEIAGRAAAPPADDAAAGPDPTAGAGRTIRRSP